MIRRRSMGGPRPNWSWRRCCSLSAEPLEAMASADAPRRDSRMLAGACSPSCRRTMPSGASAWSARPPLAFRTAPEIAPLSQRSRAAAPAVARGYGDSGGIAYQQPVTRAEIIRARRGSWGRGTLDLLVEAGWSGAQGPPRDTRKTGDLGDHAGLLDQLRSARSTICRDWTSWRALHFSIRVRRLKRGFMPPARRCLNCQPPPAGIFQVEQLSHHFGDRLVVDRVGLAISPAGKSTAGGGPSGCGKTTTLRLIAGLENLQAGGSHSTGGCSPSPAGPCRGASAGRAHVPGLRLVPPSAGRRERRLWPQGSGRRGRDRRVAELLAAVNMSAYVQNLSAHPVGRRAVAVALAKHLTRAVASAARRVVSALERRRGPGSAKTCPPARAGTPTRW